VDGSLALSSTSNVSANCTKLMPMAAQKALSSTRSIRRSPRSHLLTQDWVVCNRCANSSCVIPRSSRVWRRSLKNTAYSAEWRVLYNVETRSQSAERVYYSRS
jgi:hypothetical protein